MSTIIVTRYSTVKPLVSITKDCYRLKSVNVECYRHAILHEQVISIDRYGILSINVNVDQSHALLHALFPPPLIYTNRKPSANLT